MVGTIAEAAAIARAATKGESAPAAVAVDDTARFDSHRAEHRDAAAERLNECDPADPADAPESAASHRNRPGTTDAPDEAAAHLILAERAYAYGRSIVEAGPEPKKPGETLAIES